MTLNDLRTEHKELFYSDISYKFAGRTRLMRKFLPYEYSFPNRTVFLDFVYQCGGNEIYFVNYTIRFYGEDENYGWYDCINNLSVLFKSEEIFLYYKLKYF